MPRGICKNRIGERYGTVEVISRAQNDKTNNAMWNCLCDCGSIVTIRAHMLKRTQFCGKQCNIYTDTRIVDITGKRFGKLTAVKQTGMRKRHAEWLFKCDCGNEIKSTSTHALSGNTTSCGCSRKTHGRSYTRAYKSERWQAYMAAKRRATPMETQCSEVLDLYVKSKQLSAETGIPHEVDHIIPLQGKTVSGLHVIANLQILTRSQNRRKSRTFEVS